MRSETPTLAAFLDEIEGLLRERSELRKRVEELEMNKQGDLRPNRRKLTEREVESLREMSRMGYTNQALSEIYDIHPSNVSRIVRGIYY